MPVRRKTKEDKKRSRHAHNKQMASSWLLSPFALSCILEPKRSMARECVSFSLQEEQPASVVTKLE